MKYLFVRVPACILLCVAILSTGKVGTAQVESVPPPSSQPLPQDLVQQQKGLAERYAQFETILLRMAELTASSNPRRSTLIKRLLGQSKEKWVDIRLTEVADVLDKNRFAEAIAKQESLVADLRDLLRILESENREAWRNEQRKQLEQYLKELDSLMYEQKSLQNRTLRTADIKLLSEDEKRLEEKSRALAEKMAESTEIGPAAAKPNSDSAENSAENSDKNLSPIQRAMKQAAEKMAAAHKKLEKAEKDGSVEDQEEAVANLQRAKSELERTIRQLREEELMERLQTIEARLRTMLQLQRAVRLQTGKLNDVFINSDEAQLRIVQLQSARIAADEAAIGQIADAAIAVLREDGTAMAFTESLLLVRQDIGDVEDRLQKRELGLQTQLVEDNIIESLLELLAAVEMAKKESEDRQKNQPAEGESPPPDEQEQEQILISLITELKLIRAMQQRVNDRTVLYESQMQVPDADLVVLEQRMDELTRQQTKIARILRELRVGKQK